MTVAEKGFQRVGDKYVDRTMHVWHGPRPDGTYLCVLCGGVTRRPTENGGCDKYVPLTDEERDMCPITAFAIKK